MKNNDDDLLEIYDEQPDGSFDYFHERRESTSDMFSFLVIIGFMVCLGIKFFQSFTDDSPDENAIILQQVKLLKTIQNSQDQAEINQAALEYDSLAQILEQLETN